MMVPSDRLGLMVIKPNDDLYTKDHIFDMNFVVYVGPNVEFKIFVANYGNGKNLLSKNKILAHLLPHACSTISTQIILLKILGVI